MPVMSYDVWRVKTCKSFGDFRNCLYLCRCLTDDSSFYPARASVTAQPLARAFFHGKSQRVQTRHIVGIRRSLSYTAAIS